MVTRHNLSNVYRLYRRLPSKLLNSTAAAFGKKIPCIVFEMTDSIRNSHFKNIVQTI